MRYLLLIKHAESYRNLPIPTELMDAMGTFVGEKMKNGTILDTAGLKPTSDAWEVRIANKKVTVTDGPFTESKELVGGYAMANVKSRAEAAALAKEFMDLHLKHWPEFEGSCEVRPLEDDGSAA